MGVFLLYSVSCTRARYGAGSTFCSSIHWDKGLAAQICLCLSPHLPATPLNSTSPSCLALSHFLYLSVFLILFKGTVCENWSWWKVFRAHSGQRFQLVWKLQLKKHTCRISLSYTTVQYVKGLLEIDAVYNIARFLFCGLNFLHTLIDSFSSICE